MSLEDQLKEYSVFGPERVYLLMAIARKKENPEITSSGEIVFREVVKEEKDIDRKISKLRNACNDYGGAHKFRLYYSVNARNTVKAYFRYRERMNSWIERKMNGETDMDDKFKRLDSHWKSELQTPHSRDETYFLYDLDTKSKEARDKLLKNLRKHTAVILDSETPNGYHFVVEAFNHNKMPEFDFALERMNDRMFFLEYINQSDDTNINIR